MENSKTSPVNLQYLREISGEDEEFIKEMMELFIVSTPESIEEMEKACNENNPVRLGEIAHKMKPSAIYMGNKDLEKLLLELQELKKESRVPEDTPAKLEMVKAYSDNIIRELKKLL